MADAFQCDRCESFESGKPVAGVTFLMPDPSSSSGARKNQSNELCAPCLADLRDWLDFTEVQHDDPA